MTTAVSHSRDQPIFVNALSVPRTVTSAAGVIAQLECGSGELKEQAVIHLNSVVDQFWTELADHTDLLVQIYNENSDSIPSKRAALVLSKIYYHLQQYDDSMEFALKSEELFNLTEKTEFVEKIVTICIDRYISFQIERDNCGENSGFGDIITGGMGPGNNNTSTEKLLTDTNNSLLKSEKTGLSIDPRLLSIVERMFNRCKQEKEWLHGLGIAIECKRLDRVKDFVFSSGPAMMYQLIDYCQGNLRNPGIGSRNFRMQLVRLLIDIYKYTSEKTSAEGGGGGVGTCQQKIKFITKLLQCYCFANDVESTKELLLQLFLGEKLKIDSNTNNANSSDNAANYDKNLLLLYQLSFDVVENENQQFCRDLVGLLKKEKDGIVGRASSEGVNSGNGSGSDNENNQDKPEAHGMQAEDNAMIVDQEGTYPQYDYEKDESFTLMLQILNGSRRLDLNLEFLFKNNRTDILLIDKARKSIDASKNSILHTGHILLHAIAQSGTTSDVYLRRNIEWMGKSVMWAKFSTTASLGVVHRGHIKDSKNILKDYLPKDISNTDEPQVAGQNGLPPPGVSYYLQGGALYAMGLIHANHYEEETEFYLLSQLKQSGQVNDVLRHGACLGLGLSSMGTHHLPCVEEMKAALYTDNAISGESAAYGIGLILCGGGGSVAGQEYSKELLSYAHDTQHEKIIRGCGIAVALMEFGREESSDALVEEMMGDKDGIIRYGGCFTIAMAYCGTSSAPAINKLLHYAVSDVSDDVRRAAVISLGFVMCNQPHRVPQMIKLLATSYNPHVRYAAAIALGISGAGSSNSESYDILKPLLIDTSDFVRQGAYISMALLFQQSVSENANKFRTDMGVCIGNKHEDPITRFGALLGQGLIDAGGRNVCASFFAKSGAVRQGAAVGFLLFIQHWFWFPLIHTITLSLNPTAIIGLNKDLKMPKNFIFTSDLSAVQKHYASKDVTNKEGVAAIKDNIKDKDLKLEKSEHSVKSDGNGLKEGDNKKDNDTNSKSKKDELPPLPKIDPTIPCNDWFAYPEPVTNKKEEEEKTTAKAVLSTAGKKGNKTTGSGGPLKKILSSSGDIAGTSASTLTDKEKEADKKRKEEEEKLRKRLPGVMQLKNPARVVPGQEKYIKFLEQIPIYEEELANTIAGSKDVVMTDATDSKEKSEKSSGDTKDEEALKLFPKEAKILRHDPARYLPLLGKERQSGFLLLTDATPDEEEDLVETLKEVREKEPDPPADFEYVIEKDEK